MKKFFKRFLFSLGIVFAVGVLSSCTKSFCNVQDQAEMISIYAKNNIESINTTAQNNGILIPQEDFNTFIDNKVQEYLNSDICPVDNEGNKIESFARYAGYNKDGQAELFYNYNTWVEEAKNEIGVNNVPGKSYITYYQSSLTRGIQSSTACITPTSGYFGFEGNERYVSGKTWGQAFTDYGFLEGLFVYPISALVENLSHAFGMNGGGQILAVILTTLIVRILFLLITLPSTISQQKMSFLQPEIAKLQQKYPNANTNQYEKQKLASAQMALYKKNKVHPFTSMLVIVIQFPVFISVWNALTGSASLSRDAVLGLRLSDTIWGALTSVSGWPANPGWWTALVLILLMSAAQICSMLIPNWLNKKRMKTITKTGNSAATNETNKTMKYTQWAMTIMIVFMGFNLPSAMGVYWLMGALISILQSVLLHIIFMGKSKKNSDRKGA